MEEQVVTIKVQRKKRQRYGRGYLYPASDKWYVRYRDENGKQVSHCLGECKGMTKTQIQALRDEFMLARRKGGNCDGLGNLTIKEFAEQVWLPRCEKKCRPSTVNGYRQVWEEHFVKPLAEVKLRDFTTGFGCDLMQQIADDKPHLKTRTLSHIKSVLSGIFTCAMRRKYLNTPANPVHMVECPEGQESSDTYAYSLEEELLLIRVLIGTLQLAIALASFTGLSRAELRGLRWEDYDSQKGVLYVRRNLWHEHVGRVKREARKGKMPVIPELKQYLDAMQKPEGWVLADAGGEPLDLENVGPKKIGPIMEKLGLEWHGWHAFRRGLGHNLEELGVPAVTIQILLRHANLKTTIDNYAKPTPIGRKATAAMQQVQEAIDAAKAVVV